MKKTRQEYIHELEALQNKVYQMGLRAGVALDKAMKSLVEGDTELAKEVMREDDIIDDMIVDIEDACLLMIAKQQPIAHDLRVIATGFKISTDIERIGDHAFDIARSAGTLTEALDAERLALVQELATCAKKMVTGAMEAYHEANVQKADAVRQLDREMDEIFTRTFHALSHYVVGEKERPERATQMLFIARFLERIGDHAVNIAEWVIYLETAERIHAKKNVETV